MKMEAGRNGSYAATSQGTCLSTLKIQPSFVACTDHLIITHYLYHLLLFLFSSESVSNQPNHFNGNEHVWPIESPAWPGELV